MAPFFPTTSRARFRAEVTSLSIVDCGTESHAVLMACTSSLRFRGASRVTFGIKIAHKVSITLRSGLLGGHGLNNLTRFRSRKRRVDNAVCGSSWPDNDRQPRLTNIFGRTVQPLDGTGFHRGVFALAVSPNTEIQSRWHPTPYSARWETSV